MLTTAKHFPGRGDIVPFPSFPGFSTIDKPAKDVKAQEFRAFKYAIDAGVTFVMSEHIAVPSVADGSELPVRAGRLKNMINISVQKYDPDPSPSAISRKLAAAFPGIQNFVLRPDMDRDIYHKIESAVVKADLVILSLFVQRNRAGDPAPFRDGDLAFIKKIIASQSKTVIAMSYGNPHLIRKIPNVPVFLFGYGEGGWYGNQAVYFDSFIKLLQGKLNPIGKLPVKVSDKYPIGSSTHLRGPADMMSAAIGQKQFPLELYDNPEKIKSMGKVYTSTFIEVARKVNKIA